MQKAEVINALNKAKLESPKRNFKQSFDIVMNLAGLDMKKTENQVDQFIQLHYLTGRKVKVCALVGPELKDMATGSVDMTILVDDFDKYAANKKMTKKLAADYTFFIGQANIMPKIASAFGRVLGSRGKMPNPKAGLIVPPNANLKPLYEKLQKTVRASARTAPVVQCVLGKEDMDSEELADNFIMIYNTIVNALPGGENNVRNVFVKLTMGKPVKVAK
jgi:large subunit ribosomal protein L1